MKKLKKIPKEADLKRCIDSWKWEQPICLKCPYYYENVDDLGCNFLDEIQEGAK